MGRSLQLFYLRDAPGTIVFHPTGFNATPKRERLLSWHHTGILSSCPTFRVSGSEIPLRTARASVEILNRRAIFQRVSPDFTLYTRYPDPVLADKALISTTVPMLTMVNNSSIS